MPTTTFTPLVAVIRLSYTPRVAVIQGIPSNQVISNAGSFIINGNSITIKRAIIVVLSSSSYSISGGAINIPGLTYSVNGSVGGYVLNGQSLNFSRALKIVIGSGTFGIDFSPVLVGNELKVNIGVGVFVLTGQSVTISAQVGDTYVDADYVDSGYSD